MERSPAQRQTVQLAAAGRSLELSIRESDDTANVISNRSISPRPHILLVRPFGAESSQKRLMTLTRPRFKAGGAPRHARRHPTRPRR